MQALGRFLLIYLVPLIIVPVYWLLYRTWRLREYGPSGIVEKYMVKRTPCVFAHWHGDELVLVARMSYRRMGVLSSLSKDGTIMAHTLKLLGYRVFRGSSSRGGARGLIGLIRAIQSGGQGGLAIDGPKGPIYEVKPGIVELALRTKKPIIAISCNADRAWYVPRAWNKSYMPKPFAKIDIHYSAEIWPQAADGKDRNITEVCAEVKAALR